jgi:hypothetical protein
MLLGPTDIIAHSRPPFSRLGNLTAYDLLNLLRTTGVYTLCASDSLKMRGTSVLSFTIALFRLLSLAASHVLTTALMQEMRRLSQQVAGLMRESLPLSHHSMMFHTFIHHFLPCLRDWGPARGFWCFPNERFIGFLRRNINNRKDPEVSLINAVARQAHLLRDEKDGITPFNQRYRIDDAKLPHEQLMAHLALQLKTKGKVMKLDTAMFNKVTQFSYHRRNRYVLEPAHMETREYGTALDFRGYTLSTWKTENNRTKMGNQRCFFSMRRAQLDELNLLPADPVLAPAITHLYGRIEQWLVVTIKRELAVSGTVETKEVIAQVRIFKPQERYAYTGQDVVNIKKRRCVYEGDFYIPISAIEGPVCMGLYPHTEGGDQLEHIQKSDGRLLVMRLQDLHLWQQ